MSCKKVNAWKERADVTAHFLVTLLPINPPCSFLSPGPAYSLSFTILHPHGQPSTSSYSLLCKASCWSVDATQAQWRCRHSRKRFLVWFSRITPLLLVNKQPSGMCTVQIKCSDNSEINFYKRLLRNYNNNVYNYVAWNHWVCIISKIEIIVQEKMVLVKSRDRNSNSNHDLQARA